MAIHGKAGNSGGGDFEPCPTGPQRLICCDVVDMGVVDASWQGQIQRKHKIQIRWQSEHLTKDGKPCLLIKRYNLSMHEKSTLRKDLQAWRGKPFASDAEAEAFDIEKVIGVSGIGNVSHNRKGDQVYANLDSLMPLMKGMERLIVRDYERVCDRPGYVAPVAPEPEDDFDQRRGDVQDFNDITPDESDIGF